MICGCSVRSLPGWGWAWDSDWLSAQLFQSWFLPLSLCMASLQASRWSCCSQTRTKWWPAFGVILSKEIERQQKLRDLSLKTCAKLTEYTQWYLWWICFRCQSIWFIWEWPSAFLTSMILIRQFLRMASYGLKIYLVRTPQESCQSLVALSVSLTCCPHQHWTRIQSCERCDATCTSSPS